MHFTGFGIRSLLPIVGLFAALSNGSPNPLETGGENNNKGKVTKQICEPSATTVSGKQVCKNEVVFEDNFASLDEKKWRKDIMIPNDPDYEFVVYDDHARNAFVKDGILHLKPTIPENMEKLARKGQLDLRKRGCTGLSQNECVQAASTYNILPPVISARIKSSQAFSFKYGVIEVRAKFPDGNWLYPEMWLEPLEKFYGPGYDSGRIVIAMSRGNAELLNDGEEDIGAKLLTGGLIISGDESDRALLMKEKRRNPDLDDGWNDEFHTYKLKWSPDGVIMSVDGQDYGAVTAIHIGGFGSVLDTNKWDEGTPFAPFDREFFVTLGVGAGGIHDFPDNTTTGGHSKPWRNKSVKAKLDFLKDYKNWKDSWAWEDAALQVDHLKVTAL